MNMFNTIQKSINQLNENNIQSTFDSIAKELFSGYCIQCGGKKFLLAEIEFYYYKEGELDKPWNDVTYCRENYKAGDFFYHLSGVDICFDSCLTKCGKRKKGRGGGILIRSLYEETQNGSRVIVGPLTCVNTMLNACDNGQMPKIVAFQKRKNIDDPQSTYRFLGETDFGLIPNGNKDKKLKLAYFDKTIKAELWNAARSSYYKNRLTKWL